MKKEIKIDPKPIAILIGSERYPGGFIDSPTIYYAFIYGLYFTLNGLVSSNDLPNITGHGRDYRSTNFNSLRNLIRQIKMRYTVKRIKYAYNRR